MCFLCAGMIIGQDLADAFLWNACSSTICVCFLRIEIHQAEGSLLQCFGSARTSTKQGFVDSRFHTFKHNENTCFFLLVLSREIRE